MITKPVIWSLVLFLGVVHNTSLYSNASLIFRHASGNVMLGHDDTTRDNWLGIAYPRSIEAREPFFAPAVMWAFALSLSVKRPVDSMTTSAPTACSTRANRSPSPDDAPVTTATRPSSRKWSRGLPIDGVTVEIL